MIASGELPPDFWLTDSIGLSAGLTETPAAVPPQCPYADESYDDGGCSLQSASSGSSSSLSVSGCGHGVIVN